jgi:hypothetical protein
MTAETAVTMYKFAVVLKRSLQAGPALNAAVRALIPYESMIIISSAWDPRLGVAGLDPCHERRSRIYLLGPAPVSGNLVQQSPGGGFNPTLRGLA